MGHSLTFITVLWGLLRPNSVHSIVFLHGMRFWILCELWWFSATIRGDSVWAPSAKLSWSVGRGADFVYCRSDFISHFYGERYCLNWLSDSGIRPLSFLVAHSLPFHLLPPSLPPSLPPTYREEEETGDPSSLMANRSTGCKHSRWHLLNQLAVVN